MITDFLFIILCFLVGILLLAAELFVPGGVIGFLAAVSLGGSIVLTFLDFGPAYGMLVMLLALVSVVGILLVWVKVFPRTRMGKNVILGHQHERTEGYTAQDADLTGLVGQEGVTLTTLRPAGMATVGGERVDVVTDGRYLDPGERVRVVGVNSNRVIVHPV